jgi:predicted nucleotidyltransferase
VNYGIVAEFNPFHNGHKLVVDALKSGGDNTVTAVMSGSFVQRGECACVSVNERVKMALSNGVDLVLLLPVPYATSSAESFAKVGVDLLFGSGVVDALGFGAETDDADLLVDCVKFMQTPEFNDKLKLRLSEGHSFPRARQLALADCGECACADAISTPNNILGIEYIKAIINGGYADFSNVADKIKVVKRQGVDHDSADLTGDICSASALRELLKNGIECEDREAVRLKKSDYEMYDYFVGMDEANIRNMNAIFGSDPDKKIMKLNEKDVSDPWYSDDFETAYKEIYDGCLELLKWLIIKECIS